MLVRFRPTSSLRLDQDRGSGDLDSRGRTQHDRLDLKGVDGQADGLVVLKSHTAPNQLYENSVAPSSAETFSAKAFRAFHVDSSSALSEEETVVITQARSF